MPKLEGNNQFECELCGKKYKSKHWYESHVKSHLLGQTSKENGRKKRKVTADDTPPSQSEDSVQPSPSNAEDSNNTDYAALLSGYEWNEWSDPDGSDGEDSYFILEEEEEERRRGGQDGREQQPNAPNDKKDSSKEKTQTKHSRKRAAALVKCTECKSVFSSIEGYIKHRISHGMQAASLRIPSSAVLTKECPRLAAEVLEAMAAMNLTQGFALEVSNLVKDLLRHVHSEKFLEFCERIIVGFHKLFVKDSIFTFPSQLCVAFYENSQAYIVNKIEANQLNSILSHLIDTHNQAYEPMLASFLLKLSNKVLAFILHVIRTGEQGEYVSLQDRYATTQQSTESVEFKQLMHFIGGSNVKSVLRTALRRQTIDEWQRVVATIRNHFLISEFSEAPEEELMAWTLALDRGKLTKICDNALQFFVQLGKEVKPLERLDGSILADEVVTKITTSPNLLVKWDKLKGSLLSDEESFKLLHALISHFCVTWRNGVVSRRMDELAAQKNAQKFGTSGVAFRARLV